MSIRPAKYGDIPAIWELMREMHERSRYVERAQPVMKEGKALLMQRIQRHGGHQGGCSVVFVSETDGRIDGFVVGVLTRLYHYFDKLMATDQFWYVSLGARDGLALYGALIAWAEANPNVIEIRAGMTDAISDYRRTERFFERKGFVKRGAIYERDMDQ